MSPSPIENMIDATVRCGCCTKARRDCRCAEGVRCEHCQRCASHCEERPECNEYWQNLRDWVAQEG